SIRQWRTFAFLSVQYSCWSFRSLRFYFSRVQLVCFCALSEIWRGLRTGSTAPVTLVSLNNSLMVPEQPVESDSTGGPAPKANLSPKSAVAIGSYRPVVLVTQ